MIFPTTSASIEKNIRQNNALISSSLTELNESQSRSSSNHVKGFCFSSDISICLIEIRNNKTVMCTQAGQHDRDLLMTGDEERDQAQQLISFCNAVQIDLSLKIAQSYGKNH